MASLHIPAAGAPLCQLCATYLACQHWRHLLEGAKFALGQPGMSCTFWSSTWRLSTCLGPTTQCWIVSLGCSTQWISPHSCGLPLQAGVLQSEECANTQHHQTQELFVSPSHLYSCQEGAVAGQHLARDQLDPGANCVQGHSHFSSSLPLSPCAHGTLQLLHLSFVRANMCCNVKHAVDNCLDCHRAKIDRHLHHPDSSLYSTLT